MNKNTKRIIIMAIAMLVATIQVSPVVFANHIAGHVDTTPPPATTTPRQADPGKSTLMGTGFKFNPNDIAPTTKKYESNTDTNIKTFLETVAKILLILVSTGAVLSIVIGGFYMATSGGDTEKANKGKIIITYNIIAICIAMLSYGIIQFVIWVV